MRKFKLIRRDEKAMELPINIVVMLVVGMVALATLISIIPTPTKEMSVFVERVSTWRRNPSGRELNSSKCQYRRKPFCRNCDGKGN